MVDELELELELEWIVLWMKREREWVLRREKGEEEEGEVAEKRSNCKERIERRKKMREREKEMGKWGGCKLHLWWWGWEGKVV